MEQRERAQITDLLARLPEGEAGVVDALMPHVYDGLHALARRHLGRERADHTLNTTALVHEAYLKLVDQKKARWQNRAHFYAIASQAMRRILVNHAHRRMALKRGGGEAMVTFDEELLPGVARAEDIVQLDEALERLSKLNERQAQVVEYRFFGGLKHQEIAEVLGVSIQTVHLDWRMARAWLSRQLEN